jgi:hypothetical protein
MRLNPVASGHGSRCACVCALEAGTTRTAVYAGWIQWLVLGLGLEERRLRLLRYLVPVGSTNLSGVSGLAFGSQMAAQLFNGGNPLYQKDGKEHSVKLPMRQECYEQACSALLQVKEGAGAAQHHEFIKSVDQKQLQGNRKSARTNNTCR